MPDLPEDAVGADLGTRSGTVELGREGGEQGRGIFKRRSLEEGWRIAAREQRRYFATERLVTDARMLDIGGALFGCQLECPVDNVENVPPPRGGSATRGVLPQMIDSAKMPGELGRRKCGPERRRLGGDAYPEQQAGGTAEQTTA